MQNIARRFSWLIIGLLALVGVLGGPPSGYAVTSNPAPNPLCPGEDVFYNPSNGEDIVVPPGFSVSVFAKDLNFPVAVAFRGSARRFEVYVLESGHGLPSRCNDEDTSQGSTTNSGVVGHDNGGGQNQQDIPCQTIVLSQNTFDSGDGHFTSGYSPHGVSRPGARIPAFDSATGPGICDGAILRARLSA